MLDVDGITLASAVSGGAGSLKTKSSTKLIGEYYTGRDGDNDVIGGVDLFNYDATSNVTSSFGVYHSAGLSSRYVSASTPTTSVNTIVGSKLVLNIRAATGTVVSLQDNFTTEYWGLTNAGTMIGPAWKPAANSTTALQMQKANGDAVVTVDTTNSRLGIGATPTVKLSFGTYYINASSPTADQQTSHIRLYDSGDGGINYGIGVSLSALNIAANQDSGTIRLYTNASERLRVASDGSVGIGTAAPTTALHTLLTDAGTSAVVNVATVGHDTSGTAAAGFGGAQLWELESSTTAGQAAARIAASWYEATHATRKADLILTAYDTAEREGLRIRGNGSAPRWGFMALPR